MRWLLSSLFSAATAVAFLACSSSASDPAPDPVGNAGKSGSASGAGGGGAGGAAGQAGAPSAGSSGSAAAGTSGQGGAVGGSSGQGGSAAGGPGGAGEGGSAAGSSGTSGAGAGGASGGSSGAGGSASGGQAGKGGAAVEVCNGKDDDGDGDVDEGCDSDGDGFCVKGMPVLSGATCKAGDCDDTNAKIYPDSKEHMEGVDYDCDGRKEYLATLILTVDDALTELCFNGEQIPFGPNSANWTATDTYSFVLKSGDNAVGISGQDVGKAITAMAAHLSVNGQSFPSRGVPAGKVYVPSDPEWNQTPWRYFGKKVDEDKSNWCSQGFNDSTWGPAMAAAGAGSPSTLVGEATPWGCGTDLCTAFPQGDQRPSWIWDPFPVDLQSAWIRIKVVLP